MCGGIEVCLYTFFALSVDVAVSDQLQVRDALLPGEEELSWVVLRFGLGSVKVKRNVFNGGGESIFDCPSGKPITVSTKVARPRL